MINREKILSAVDHTLLKQNARISDIHKLCDEAIKYGTASVCIPPCYVREAKSYVNDKIKICTVIGFPNGNNTTAVKVFETEDAVANGAEEIDMVINIGWLKDKRLSDISAEIKAVREACRDKILKVIIETCLLTDEEKKEMCTVVYESGADYIKTSTGFSTGGATPEDVTLLRHYSNSALKVKAAGGISSFEDAEIMMNNGADRLGTSRLVKICEAENKEENR